MRNILILILLLIVGCKTKNVIKLTESDAKFKKIERQAERTFKKTGKGKGTGYNQYKHWAYEAKFHVNKKGFLTTAAIEDSIFRIAPAVQVPNTPITWKEIPLNSFKASSGWNPGVGRVTSIAVFAKDSSIIYVATPGGGIWKSTTAGKSWTPLTDFISSGWMAINHVIVSPTNSNIVYATHSSGVLKTVNGGSTWLNIVTISNSKKIIFDPKNENTLYVSSAAGIYKSINAGTSFVKTSSIAAEDIEINTFNSSIVYASHTNGAYISKDAGMSFNKINSIGSTGRTMIAVTPNSPSTVYVIQANGSAFGGFYRSNDSGNTFIQTIVGSPASGTNYFGYDADGRGNGGQASYDMAIAVSPKNFNEVHIAGIICWKSLDGGNNFKATTEWYYPNPTGYNHADVHALEYFGNTLYSGTDGGIYKSVNRAEDWTDLSTGLGIKQVYRFSNSLLNSNVITIGAQDNGSSYRQPNGTWLDWLGGDGMETKISPIDYNKAIGTTQNGVLYRTTNAGQSFYSIAPPVSGNWITPFVMHPKTHDTLFVGWQGVWKSSNFGTSWTKLSGNTITGKLNTLAISKTNPKYIYGSVDKTLYASKDGGKTWAVYNTPATITSIAVNTSPEEIWLTFNSGSTRVYMSTNAGASFKDVSAGLPGFAARSVAIDEKTGIVYVGMNIGVYFYESNTWKMHGVSLPNASVNQVEVLNTKIRVATYGRGIWESDLQKTVAVNVDTAIYVNDLRTHNDVFTHATGDDNNPGTIDAPFRTIAKAVSFAAPGALIKVDAGFYDESLILSKPVNIIGAKDSTWIQLPFSTTSVGCAIYANNVQLKNLLLFGFYKGVLIQSKNVTLNNVHVTSSRGYCIGISGASDRITIKNSRIDASYMGVYVDPKAPITNLLIDSCRITTNTYGFEMKAANLYVPADFISLTNTGFSNNKQKNIYIERGNNITLTKNFMDKSGTSVQNAYNTAIELNMRYGVYTNAIISGNRMTNCALVGVDSTRNAVLVVVGRDDSKLKGSISNVTISNNFFNSPKISIRIGEPAKGGDSTKNVTVSGNTFLVPNSPSNIVNHTKTPLIFK